MKARVLGAWLVSTFIACSLSGGGISDLVREYHLSSAVPLVGVWVSGAAVGTLGGIVGCWFYSNR